VLTVIRVFGTPVLGLEMNCNSCGRRNEFLFHALFIWKSTQAAGEHRHQMNKNIIEYMLREKQFIS
jgi:hypothetical protein